MLTSLGSVEHHSEKQQVHHHTVAVISAALSSKKVNESSMRLLIPSIISKHTLLDVNGLKSDRALYKVAYGILLLN